MERQIAPGRSPAHTATARQERLSGCSLSIHLLGGFRVTLDGRPVEATAWRLQKASALVKLLALAPAFRLHRDQVMDLLWPDLEVEAAANNLYYALHVARRALAVSEPRGATASPLRLQQQVLSLHSEGELFVDVAAFEAASAAARGTRDAAAHANAVRLYAGDLLPEDRYEDWTTGRREALRESYLALLLAMARLREEEGDYDGALEALERVTSAEPTHEDAHAGMMRMYAYTDRKRQALRQFERLREALRRELGAEPERETVRLREAIQRGTLAAPAAPAYRLPTTARVPSNEAPAADVGAPATPRPAAEDAREQRARSAPPAPALPLVGRERELSRVEEATSGVGDVRVVAITGEQGIGKSRLAEEVLYRAERAGSATAQARCYAANGSPAYTPVATWLRTEPLWRGLLTLDDLWLTEVARVVPELLVERPRLAQPGPLAEPWQRQRFFEALARAFDACPGAHLRLLLDDLQWCDGETLACLRYVTLERAAGRFTLLVTERPEELGDKRGVAVWLADLRRAGRIVETELAALDGDATARLATLAAGCQLETGAGARFFAETEGNPLFVVEMARARMGGRDARAAANSSEHGARALPPTIAAALAARLAQLSPPARELAGVAAAVGREFTFELVAAASARDEDAVVNALDELWRRRIIREREGNLYDFSHDKLRVAAYGELSAARRRLIHRRIAQALLGMHAGALDAVSGRIAGHFALAGQDERAMPYYERAAELARTLYANGQAEVYYRAAVASLDRLGRTVVAAQVRESLAQVLTLMARYDDALDELARATAAYFSVGDSEAEGRATAHVGRVHALRGTPLEGVERLRPLLDADAVVVYSPPTLAALHITLAHLWSNLGRYADQLTCALEAAQYARQADDRRLLIQANRFYGLALLMLGKPREAASVLEQVIPLAEAADELDHLCFACNNAGIAYMTVGELKKSRSYAERAVCLAEQIGAPVSLAFMLHNRAAVAFLQGDWEAAQRDDERADELLRPVGLTWVSANPPLGLGRLALARGEWERGERLLARSVDLATRSGSVYPLHMAVEGLAEWDLLRGEPEVARERLAPYVGDGRDAETDAGGQCALLAWAKLDLGDEDAASSLIERAMENSATTQNVHTRLLALGVRARLAMAQGRWDVALADMEEKLALARAMGNPSSEAVALYELGSVLAGKGERVTACERLNDALAIFARLGERLYAEQAEHALERLGAS